MSCGTFVFSSNHWPSASNSKRTAEQSNVTSPCLLQKLFNDSCYAVLFV